MLLQQWWGIQPCITAAVMEVTRCCYSNGGVYSHVLLLQLLQESRWACNKTIVAGIMIIL